LSFGKEISAIVFYICESYFWKVEVSSFEN
jgi:hypothetical protein